MQATINGIDTRPVLSNEEGGPRLTLTHHLGANGTGGLMDATMQSVLTAAYRKAHPEVVEQLSEAIVRSSDEGFAKAAGAIRDFDASGQSASIRTPASIIVGEHAKDVPPERTKAVVDATPGAHFEILDAAHLSAVEETQGFAAVLETFLREQV